MTFAQKGAIAFAALILGFALTSIGFEPNQEQTDETLKGLKTLMSLIPLVGVCISIVLVYFYPIDKTFHKKLIQDIQDRKISNA
jgi:GPH family glycoside/pentoside/hexuronide:cation symporter